MNSNAVSIRPGEAAWMRGSPAISVHVGDPLGMVRVRNDTTGEWRVVTLPPDVSAGSWNTIPGTNVQIRWGQYREEIRLRQVPAA